MVGHYPRTVLEVIDPKKKFRPETLKVLKRFRKMKPWQGSVEERQDKFRWLNRKLADIYHIAVPNLQFGVIDCSFSGDSFYSRQDHLINLSGKLSVVTYLHEFAHARGMDERAACTWSINLFRRCFPMQFSKLIFVGHTLIHPRDLGTRDANPAPGTSEDGGSSDRSG